MILIVTVSVVEVAEASMVIAQGSRGFSVSLGFCTHDTVLDFGDLLFFRSAVRLVSVEDNTAVVGVGLTQSLGLNCNTQIFDHSTQP